jgi:hypothetical protein
VVAGELFVVADGAAVCANPGEGALDDLTAGQDLEGVQVIGAADDLHGEAQRGRSAGEPACLIAAVGPDQADSGAGPAEVP